MKKSCLFALIAFASDFAHAEANDAPQAMAVDYKQVCEQVMKAFTDCGYPDPGVAEAGGCTEALGKAWASRLQEEISQNKTRLASMSASSGDNMYQQLACINAKYEAISAVLR